MRDEIGFDAAIERHVHSPIAWLPYPLCFGRRAHRPAFPSLSTAIFIPLWSILGGTVVRLEMVFASSRAACVGRPAPLNGCNSCLTYVDGKGSSIPYWLGTWPCGMCAVPNRTSSNDNCPAKFLSRAATSLL